jgi:hypothetical protein
MLPMIPDNMGEFDASTDSMKKLGFALSAIGRAQ